MALNMLIFILYKLPGAFLFLVTVLSCFLKGESLMRQDFDNYLAKSVFELMRAGKS